MGLRPSARVHGAPLYSLLATCDSAVRKMSKDMTEQKIYSLDYLFSLY